MIDHIQRQVVAIPAESWDETCHELPFLTGDAYHTQPVVLYDEGGQVYARGLETADAESHGYFMEPAGDRALVCARGTITGDAGADHPHLSVDLIWAVLK